MLVTDDVVNLFAAMRTAYGGQWKHGNEAVNVWRKALYRHDAERVQQAMTEAMNRYVNHPPTLPQFLELLRPRERPNTYLPAPQMPKLKAAANRVALRSLLSTGGVDKRCLKTFVDLENALLEEPDITAESMELQLTELAKNHDRTARRQETAEARRRMFGGYPGFVE